MKRLILIFLSTTFISCKTILLNHLLKDPVVETTTSIREFQTRNNYSIENSLILQGDTLKALGNLFMGISVGYYVFDSVGRQVCYNGSATCSGTQFKQLAANQVDSFKLCDNSKETLESVLQETYDLNGKPVSIQSFSEANYYVVTYWQKFLGGKRGYEESVNWMENEVKNSKSKKKFTFIKINTDLQDTWGLVAGEKAKLKWKKKGNIFSLEIDKLPVSK